MKCIVGSDRGAVVHPRNQHRERRNEKMIIRQTMTLLAILTLVSGATASTVLYDNFGPGDEYNHQVGWTIGLGGSEDHIEAGPGFRMNMGGDYYLDAIDAPIQFYEYVPGAPNEVTLSVYDTAEDAFEPGDVLETLFTTDLTTNPYAPPRRFEFSGTTLLEESYCQKSLMAS
ncbi:MAG: hypothetical protein PVJ57_21650 [Phycisphaerae bacterium]|jgi:hypothetical protein